MVKGQDGIDNPAVLYPGRSIIASMDIPVLSNPVSQLTSQPTTSATLFTLLAKEGAIQARVASINPGQTLLTTRLGQFLTSNLPGIKVGDLVTLRADNSRQTPTLKIDNIVRNPLTLDISRDRALGELFSTTRQIPAIVTKQDSTGTFIQAGNRQFKLTVPAELKPGQLLLLVRGTAKHSLEIHTVNHQQVLKSAISNLIPTQNAETTASSLHQIARLIRQYTALNNSGAISSTGPMTKLIPELNQVDKTVIKKWLGYIFNPPAGKAETSRTEQSTFQLLQNLFKPGSAVINQVRQLHGLSGSEADQITESLADNRLLHTLGREIIKLGEQSLNQLLFQQASLRLQQEQQQPLLLHLSIPLYDEGKPTEIDLKIGQRKAEVDEENQLWDIHIEFNFGSLGHISTQLTLSGNVVSASFWAEKSKTTQEIQSRIAEFESGISGAGLVPGQIQSFHGKPPGHSRMTKPTIPDALLDVRV